MYSRETPHPFFSVVVPVYKVPIELLMECLNSLAAQDCAYAEYIIVDDGSPDNCGLVCDQFAQERPAFRVVHNPNRGVSLARNAGIELARGKYVVFVDGDDRMPVGFLNKLYQFKDRLLDVNFYNCEASSHLVSKIANDDVVLPSPFILAKSIVAFSEHSLDLGHVVLGSPWGKAINLDYLRSTGCRFPAGIRKAQDRVFMVDLLSHNPKCCYLPLTGYTYVQNASSVSHKYNPKAQQIAAQTCSSMHEVIESRYSGAQKNELMNALRIFKLTFFFEIIDLDVINEGNPNTWQERLKDFREIVHSYSDCFAIPDGFCAPSQRISIATRLLQKGCTNLAFIFLNIYKLLK
jgi:hypothetical protein